VVRHRLLEKETFSRIMKELKIVTEKFRRDVGDVESHLNDQQIGQALTRLEQLLSSGKSL